MFGWFWIKRDKSEQYAPDTDEYIKPWYADKLHKITKIAYAQHLGVPLIELNDPEIKKAIADSPKVAAAWDEVQASPMSAMKYMADPEFGWIVQKIMGAAQSFPGGLMGLVACVAARQQQQQ